MWISYPDSHINLTCFCSYSAITTAQFHVHQQILVNLLVSLSFLSYQYWHWFLGSWWIPHIPACTRGCPQLAYQMIAQRTLCEDCECHHKKNWFDLFRGAPCQNFVRHTWLEAREAHSWRHAIPLGFLVLRSSQVILSDIHYQPYVKLPDNQASLYCNTTNNCTFSSALHKGLPLLGSLINKHN